MRQLPYIVFLVLAVIGCRSVEVGYQEKRSRIVIISKSENNESNAAIINGRALGFPDNFAVPNATIEITSKSSHMKTASDESGVFSFKAVPSGNYLMKSNYVGLYQLRDSIRVETGMILTLKLVFVYDR